MATIKPLRGTTATYGFVNASGAGSLAGLANNAAWQTAAFDDTPTAAQNIDQLVQVKLRTSTTTTAGQIVAIYAAGSLDGGTTWPEGMTNNEGAVTLSSTTNPNLRLVGTITVAATAAASYVGPLLAVAPAFGGQLPPRWALVLVNQTGVALDGTIGNFAILTQSVQYQIV